MDSIRPISRMVGADQWTLSRGLLSLSMLLSLVIQLVLHVHHRRIEEMVFSRKENHLVSLSLTEGRLLRLALASAVKPLSPAWPADWSHRYGVITLDSAGYYFRRQGKGRCSLASSPSPHKELRHSLGLVLPLALKTRQNEEKNEAHDQPSQARSLPGRPDTAGRPGLDEDLRWQERHSRDARHKEMSKVSESRKTRCCQQNASPEEKG